MFKLDLFKLDPIAHLLLLAVLALELYTSFLRGPDADEILDRSDANYRAAVFGSDDNKGVMHQIFRQNEVDRDLLKATLAACSK